MKKAPRKTALDMARDELFHAIRQCGVMDASTEEQAEWMAETVEYMKERHPALSSEELRQLEATGRRFCQPVIPHGAQHRAAAEDANAA
jgi:hypothetical protein